MAEDFREFQGGQNSTENNGRNNKQKKSAEKKASSIVAIVLVCLFLVITLFESVYSIKEQEQGVVTTFGKAGSVVTSGLHFKIPYVQDVTKVNTTIQGFPIGYSNDDEYSSSDSQAESESLMITSDFNFVNVDFYVEYKVSDPVKYLYNSRQPEEILKNISQACIRNVVSNYSVDDVITTGKNEIQAAIKEMIVDKLDEQDIGLMLVNISLQDAEPPTTEVIEAFKAVETAKQGKETAINNANKYQNEKIPEATAKADQITQDAEASKQERINEATAQVVRFNEMYEEYIKNPLITKQRMFYEAMEDVLPGVTLVIDDGSGSITKNLYLDTLKIDTDADTEETTSTTEE